MAATSKEFLDYTSESPNEDGNFDSVLTDVLVYGGSNPARVDVNVYISGEKIKQDDSVDFDVTFDSYTPSSASTFSFEVTKDGYYKFKYVAIPDYDNAHDYAQYDVVYSAGVVYQAFANPSTGTAPTNPSFWEVVSSPTDLIDEVGSATEAGNLLYQVYERILYPFTKTAAGDTAETAALECCSDCERGEDVKTYELLAVLADGMNSADQRGKTARGERIARKAQEVIDAL